MAHGIDDYVRKEKNKIEGWLTRCDAEIFKTILRHQAEEYDSGSVVEIGVHHGKSFILLALSNSGKACYAIDIFDRQELNIDCSGQGSKTKFINNLRRCGILIESIVIDERPSFEVSCKDIKTAVGLARFFHIDGGHHADAVKNDLRLADEAIADFGVISVDDAFRADWPDVCSTVYCLLRDDTWNLQPFAVGYNKMYLCRPHFVQRYRNILLKNEILNIYYNKNYKSEFGEFPVYSTFFWPEWKKRQIFTFLMYQWHPELALKLKNWKHAFVRRAQRSSREVCD